MIYLKYTKLDSSMSSSMTFSPKIFQESISTDGEIIKSLKGNMNYRMNSFRRCWNIELDISELANDNKINFIKNLFATRQGALSLDNWTSQIEIVIDEEDSPEFEKSSRRNEFQSLRFKIYEISARQSNF